MDGGEFATFTCACAVRSAKNTASPFMKSVCFGVVDLCGESMVSHRSDGRDVDVCSTLMPCGKRCEKIGGGWEQGGDGCVRDVWCIETVAFNSCTESLGGRWSGEFGMMSVKLHTDAGVDHGREAA